MSTIREWWRRLVHRRELEGGLDEEIQFHIDHQIEKNVRQGMSASEARRQALLRFGGVERAKESTRDEFRPVIIEDLTRDLRYGLRTLLRSPSFALIAVLTLGIGIGASTAVFTVVNGVLLRPLPYPQSDRIVRPMQVDGNGPQRNVSEPNFQDWKDQSRSFSAMAVVASRLKVTVTGTVEPNLANIAVVSREFFDVMQVYPAVGRGFAPEEQQLNGTPAVILSDEYWRKHLGGRRDFQNQSLSLYGRVYHVVGVMPPGFNYPNANALWLAREVDAPNPSRTAHNFRAIARLADGVTVEQAARELSAISRAVKQKHGDNTWMSDGTVIPLQTEVTGSAGRTLLILLGASVFLLVIACANVSNLLIVRAASRRREMAVRLAIGAGRWRVARQLLAESLVLCTAGAGIGVLLAYWGVRTLRAMNPGTVPRLAEISVNWTVVAFAVSVAFAIAIVLGLATALRQGARDLRTVLIEGQRSVAGGGRQQRLRDILVVTQVALTLVLLTGAGLLARSFMTLMSIDPGYTIDRALVFELNMQFPEDAQGGARQTRFLDDLMGELRRLPGVTGVAGVNDFPLGGTWYANGQYIEMNSPDEFQGSDDVKAKFGDAGVRERAGLAGFRVASEEYFKVMGMRLVRGRLFEPSDGPDAPHVAVISESMAKDRWPDRDPIGRFIQFGNMDGDRRGFRIVGVVSDVREISLENAPAPLFYASARQRPGAASRFTIVVNGTDSPETSQAVQRIVRRLDPQLPVAIATAQSALDRSLSTRRFSMTLLGVFSAAALVLATMGLYGVMAYVASQRTREIGIRIALGADRATLVKVVVGRGAALAGIGIAVGLISAWMLGKVVQGMLYGVAATDPVAIIGVVLLIGSAVTLASYLPARRALRVAPIITLRSD